MELSYQEAHRNAAAQRLMAQSVTHIREHRIEFIKLIRERTGMSLGEAKEFANLFEATTDDKVAEKAAILKTMKKIVSDMESGNFYKIDVRMVSDRVDKI